MFRAVWNFDLEEIGIQEIELPTDAQILGVGIAKYRYPRKTGRGVTLFVLTSNPNIDATETIKRKFEVVTNMYPLQSGGDIKYIGTCFANKNDIFGTSVFEIIE